LSPAFAISLFYFSFLGALGFFWPFFSLYLAELGLAPHEITRVLALSPIMGLLAPPLLGLLADARRARGWLLRGASIGAVMAFAALYAARARPAIYAATAAYALCRAPLLSMTDASAFENVRRHGGSYGGMRVWGSVGFMLAVLGGGEILQSHGLSLVLLTTTASLGVAALCAWAMPAPPPEQHPEVVRAWLRMVGAADVWIFLLAVALGQAAHAVYDSSYSLHLAREGHSTRFVGVAWAIGVGFEVALLFASGRLIGRFGASRLLAFGFAVAALRWIGLAHARSDLAILALQPLHAISFGLTYASGVTVMRERGGAETPTAAQGLYAAAFALGSIGGMSSAGRILEAHGDQVLFSGAAVVSAVACVCAIIYVLRGRLNPIKTA
jgi:MFS transporter, PPP family, 3-phenylpropionic acid transporter